MKTFQSPMTKYKPHANYYYHNSLTDNVTLSLYYYHHTKTGLETMTSMLWDLVCGNIKIDIDPHYRALFCQLSPPIREIKQSDNSTAFDTSTIHTLWSDHGSTQ